MRTLSQIERLLWQLITAPEGVEPALVADASGQLGVELRRTVAHDARLNPVERLDIYANMYFARILDVLKDDYPAVLAVVGQDAFHNLVTDYLLAHAPTKPSLRFAGAHLPRFLRGHPQLELHPFLAELADFEWALVDSFDAPDSSVLTQAQLAVFPPETWANLKLLLQPAFSLLDLHWPVSRLRKAVDLDERVERIEPEALAVCVWRHDYRVRFREITPLERTALGVIASGGTFGEVCTRLEEFSAPEPTERVASFLAHWLSDGLLSGCEITWPEVEIPGTG